MTLKFATPLLVLGLLLAGADHGYSQSSKEAKEAELKGEAAMKSGDLDAAIANFSEAIRLNPNCAVAYGNRGFAHENMGKFDAAKADYDEAGRLDPKSQPPTAAVARHSSRNTTSARQSQSTRPPSAWTPSARLHTPTAPRRTEPRTSTTNR